MNRDVAGSSRARPRGARSRVPAARAWTGVLFAVLSAGSAGCGALQHIDRFPASGLPDPLPDPEPSDVESVVFLVGDAGNAREDRAPLLRQMGMQVERWSAALGRDSAVAVVFLGDNVYELGVHAEDHEDFAEDVSKLTSQVRVVAGPDATRNRALGLFIPGNHDWGNVAGPDGVQLLNNMDGQLAVHRADSIHVELYPDPGEPGPAIVDTPGIRFIALDTHWWLQAGRTPRKDSVIAAVGRALAESGDRITLVAAHHPMLSGGPHGGLVAFSSGLGLRYLANRGGALIQDISAAPYDDLIRRLRSVFAEHGPPSIYAAGHEHSLQIFSDTLAGGAAYTHLVSGAGSKVSPLGPADDMVWGASAPGYMRVTVLKSGDVLLHVFTTDEAKLACPAPADEAYEQCMTEGVQAVHLEYGARIS